MRDIGLEFPVLERDRADEGKSLQVNACQRELGHEAVHGGIDRQAPRELHGSRLAEDVRVQAPEVSWSEEEVLRRAPLVRIFLTVYGVVWADRNPNCTRPNQQPSMSILAGSGSGAGESCSRFSSVRLVRTVPSVPSVERWGPLNG